MNRRHFLSMVGAGAWLPLWNPSAWAVEDSNRRVIVVGAGLSGLSTAYELAIQGVQVEVIEAQPRVGGRYASWSEEGLGGLLVQGHTPLTIWPQAEQLRGFLSQMELLSAFEPHPVRADLLVDGRRVEASHPLSVLQNLRAVWARARSSGERGIPLKLQRGMSWLRRTAPEEIVTELDGLSVEEWLGSAGKLTPWTALGDLYLPLLFSGQASEVDAASFILAEQQMLLADASKPLLRPWLSGEEDLWTLLQSRLEALGVVFRLGVEVSELRLSAGRVSGLTLGEFLPGAWVSEVPVGWTEVHREEASSVFVRRSPSGMLEAFSSREGRSEDALYVVEGADGIHIEGEDRRHHLEADSVVLACGPESAWALAGDLLSMEQAPPLRERVSARFWVGSPLDSESSSWVLCDGEQPVMATALSRFDEASQAWADDDGAVLSLERLVGPDEEDASLLVELQGEIARCWPEMDGAPVLESRLQRWTVPLLTPGFSTRAPAHAAVPGLHLAGEHLLVEPGVLGAEAAIRSGRLAAASALGAIP